MGGIDRVEHIQVVENDDHEYVYVVMQYLFNFVLTRIKTEVNRGVDAKNSDTNVFVDMKRQSFNFWWKGVDCDYEDDFHPGCTEFGPDRYYVGTFHQNLAFGRKEILLSARARTGISGYGSCTNARIDKLNLDIFDENVANIVDYGAQTFD